ERGRASKPCKPPSLMHQVRNCARLHETRRNIPTLTAVQQTELIPDQLARGRVSPQSNERSEALLTGAPSSTFAAAPGRSSANTVAIPHPDRFLRSPPGAPT